MNNFSCYLRKSFDESVDNYFNCYQNAANSLSEKAVHDLRVSVRRLNTIQDILYNHIGLQYMLIARRHIKYQFNKLSSLRDIQVLLLLANQIKKKYPEISDFIEYLLLLENNTINNLKKFICEENLIETKNIFFFLQIELKYSDDFNEISPKVILEETNYKYMQVDDLSAKLKRSQSETIHQLRIAFKKFRYSYEFIYPFLDDAKYKPKDLAKYQTLMGEVQDIDVFITKFAKYIDNSSRISNKIDLFSYIFDKRRKLINDFWKRKDDYRKFGELTLKI